MKRSIGNIADHLDRLLYFVHGQIGWSSKQYNLKWSASTVMSRVINHLKPLNCRGSLLPTPTTSNNRNSRNAILKIGKAHKKHGVALGLAQVLEIAVGILPKEFDSWIQIPAYYKRIQVVSLDRVFYRGNGCFFLNPLFVQQMMGFSKDWIIVPFYQQKFK